MPIVEKPPKEEEFVLPPFRFNPLHDLESTLWIGFWALLYHQRHDDFQARTLERYFHERPSDQRIDTVSRMVAIKSGFPCAPADGPSVPATDVLNILRRRLLDHYIAFEQDFDPRFGLLRTPTLVTPLEAAQDFIVQYETAGSLFRNVLPATPAKREPTNDLDPEESHSSVPPSVSPAGRSKKNGSATKKSVNSNKTSPGSRKVRSTGLHASRRSSRIAARKKNLKPSGGSK
jgi:hypothetical protein